MYNSLSSCGTFGLSTLSVQYSKAFIKTYNTIIIIIHTTNTFIVLIPPGDMHYRLILFIINTII